MSSMLTTATHATGTVQWFHGPKGFGYIARDDGQPDCFVHRYDFHGGLMTLAAGDRVEFDVVERGRCPWARNVTRRSPRQP